MSNLNSDIRYLKGFGEKKAAILYNMGIDTIGALLRFCPRAYTDLRNVCMIKDAKTDEKCAVKAKIITPVTEQFIRKNMTLFKFNVSDGRDIMTVTLFNAKFLAKSLHEGSTYIFYGKLSLGTYLYAMSAPEIYESENNSIIPIYKANEKLSSRMISKLMKTALNTDIIEDTLSEEIRRKYGLCPLKTALDNIHFPKSAEALNVAKKRLVFEELLILEVSLTAIKNKKQFNSGYVLKADKTKEFLSLLPYTLTNSQLSAISECMNDMTSGKVMARLIEGDVGSGKTAVAACLMYNVCKNGYTCAIMAPTEILAQQHYNTLKSIFANTDIECCLLTGSLSKSKKESIKEELKSGKYGIAVGTHALITENVEIKNLALVITDEQHRFGVEQRSKLASKGKNVHNLVMSATPIPRTLGLIIYGDLDISIINEYPKGRQKIESYLVTSKYHTRIYNYIKKHIEEGRQGYIVCPLVEESENTENLLSAEQYFENLKNGEFKNYRLGLLHGQMKPKEKEKVMLDFKQGLIDVLVCTTVVEVGIDVPNATIMVIENADRFGLSQLHQLRGRIGRGKFKSTCIFVSDSDSKSTKERLKVIVDNFDGFKIADEDLKLRGPGDFIGKRQHGLPEFKIADIFADKDILFTAKKAADNLLESDPKLSKTENLPLKKEVIEFYRKLN
ncbi:MAG: ATP-dependent DNA helicase RecG [Clostridia bacterium]|nr:ATP-dependent DNA helicase RecG [Clostridia bacterium]